MHNISLYCVSASWSSRKGTHSELIWECCSYVCVFIYLCVLKYTLVGYVFVAVLFHLCVFVCLFVCLCVCLDAAAEPGDAAAVSLQHGPHLQPPHEPQELRLQHRRGRRAAHVNLRPWPVRGHQVRLGPAPTLWCRDQRPWEAQSQATSLFP